MKIVQRVHGRKLKGINPMTLKVDLEFESAHHRTESDIWVKLTINRSKGSEDIERTQNWRVNPTTLKCDLDLELNENRSNGPFKLL